VSWWENKKHHLDEIWWAGSSTACVLPEDRHSPVRTKKPQNLVSCDSNFLSEQTSHQQSSSSTFLSEQTSTSHQPKLTG
jgi:hypothetical protein